MMKNNSKENKNKAWLWLIAGVLFILIVIVLLWWLLKDDAPTTYNIADTQELWLIYDMNLEKIENNYQEISTPNTDIVCNTINEINIDDEYRNVTEISDLDLKDLNFHLMDQKELYNNRIDRSNLAISEVEERSEVILNIIDDFLGFDEGFYDFGADYYDVEIHTYQELFIHKLVEMEKVANLSQWLKDEYYSLVD